MHKTQIYALLILSDRYKRVVAIENSTRSKYCEFALLTRCGMCLHIYVQSLELGLVFRSIDAMDGVNEMLCMEIIWLVFGRLVVPRYL